MDDDVVDIVNKYRMKLPKYQEDTKKQIEYISKNFLTIPYVELLNDTTACCQTTSDMMQSIFIRLEIAYEATNSSKAYQQMIQYEEMIEKVDKLIHYLEKTNSRIPSEKLALIYCSVRHFVVSREQNE